MIEVDNLTYTYPGADGSVLRDLNFKISEGEIFGFLGPSGAGKSTTQKILYKILNGYQGEILIDSIPLIHWGRNYFEKIGVSFELPNHYLKLTGKENLELFAAFYQKKRITPIRELFERVSLLDAMDQKVEAYSKGMKMRLNFIRSVMHNPDILFFDEPTSGMDPVNAHTVKEMILDLKKQGKTIFITTHDMATADELCDNVALLVDGQIRLVDEPAILKRKYGKESVKVELKDNKSMEFELKGLGKNQSFIDFLNMGNLSSIKSQEASLEEVFIKVTGQTLHS